MFSFSFGHMNVWRNAKKSLRHKIHLSPPAAHLYDFGDALR